MENRIYKALDFIGNPGAAAGMSAGTILIGIPLLSIAIDLFGAISTCKTDDFGKRFKATRLHHFFSCAEETTAAGNTQELSIK